MIIKIAIERMKIKNKNKINFILDRIVKLKWKINLAKRLKKMRIKIDIKNKKNFFYWKIKLKRKITLIKRKK
jgi:hypothetical protein